MDEVEDVPSYGEDPWVDDWDWEWPEEPQITYRDAIARLRSSSRAAPTFASTGTGSGAFRGTTLTGRQLGRPMIRARRFPHADYWRLVGHRHGE